MEKLLAGTTASYGATYTLDYIPASPVTFNDPVLAAASKPALEAVVGQDQVITPPVQMVSEDFAFYQQKIPGFFFFLGVANPEKGITSNLHTETFDLDESALSVGVRAMSSVVGQALWR
jgi:metal-dependent amidase/aminoacylase/carboxypeptidase family protein